jgi:hypothetical protein
MDNFCFVLLEGEIVAIKPRTICSDGTSLSIQASRTHYCTPREDEGPYLALEVGYILDANGDQLTPPESWADYTDGSEFPNDVYGYVPVELIESFIANHGGRANG